MEGRVGAGVPIFASLWSLGDHRSRTSVETVRTPPYLFLGQLPAFDCFLRNCHNCVRILLFRPGT